MKRGHGQRLMCVGHADALGALINGGTWVDVSAATGLTRTSAKRLLHRMVDAELIHESEWASVRSGVRKIACPVYRLGEGGQLRTWPGEGARRFRKRQPLPVELLSFCIAIRALQDDSHNSITLAESTGISRTTTNRLLRKLHALHLVYVEDFCRRKDGAVVAPMYAWGPGQKDAKRPPKLTSTELTQRCRQKRASLALHAQMLGVTLDNCALAAA